MAADHVGRQQRPLCLMGALDRLVVVAARGAMIAEVEGKPSRKPARLAGCGGQPSAKFRGRRLVSQPSGEAKMLKGRPAELLGWGHALQPSVVAGDGGDRRNLVRARRQRYPLAEAKVLFHPSGERDTADCLEGVQELSSTHLPISCPADRLDCGSLRDVQTRGAKVQEFSGQPSCIGNVYTATFGDIGQLDQGIREVQSETLDSGLDFPGFITDRPEWDDRRRTGGATITALPLAAHRLSRLASRETDLRL